MISSSKTISLPISSRSYSDASRDDVSIAVSRLIDEIGDERSNPVVLNTYPWPSMHIQTLVDRVDGEQRVRPVESLALEATRLLSAACLEWDKRGVVLTSKVGNDSVAMIAEAFAREYKQPCIVIEIAIDLQRSVITMSGHKVGEKHRNESI